jgi:NAD(P)-dependent dehydrogenase (short-subunit alcohol dehydrogenase family)
MGPKTDLKGKVAVITGGASGVGLALALRAAQEGMKVALADADECLLAAALEQVKARNVGAIAVHTDIADAGSVRTLARRTEAELGPPWLVCNNSGASPFGPGWKVALAHLKWVIDVNLWGVINGVQVFASGMVERDAGHLRQHRFHGPFRHSRCSVLRRDHACDRRTVRVAFSRTGCDRFPGWGDRGLSRARQHECRERYLRSRRSPTGAAGRSFRPALRVRDFAERPAAR